MENWANNELKYVDIGDVRLNKRAKKVIESMVSSPENSINGTFRSWAETKAAYRFFDNRKVTPEKILQPHLKKLRERAKQFNVILHVQDTTQINYSHRKEKVKGLGKLRLEKEQGFFVHPTIAFSEEGLCLGVLNAKILVREEIMGPEARSKSKPIEEKESIRWLESYKITQEEASLNPQKTYINISDREGDFYEFIEKYDPDNAGNAHILVRGKKVDRVIQDNGDGVTKLWEKLKQQAPSCSIKFNIRAIRNNAKKNRETREIIQDVKFCEVIVGPAQKKKNGKQLKARTKITAILCSEKDKSVKDPIEWLLLTTMPVSSSEEALKLVQYYIYRWQIELYFKVLKSGCAIEELQLESLERIQNCLALYMIIAWRILFLTMIGRCCPNLSCELFYDKDEWEAAWQVAYKEKVPKNPPSINEINRIIAGFAGFLDRKNDGEPGIKVMWEGLHKLMHFVIAYASFKQLHFCG